MRKIAYLLFAFLLLIMASHCMADMAAIHVDRLPQETSVLAAFDDAQQLEPYSRSWSNKWQFPVSRDEVATRLGKDLGFLTISLKSHPDNAELLILTGLVARYAYNLDVNGSYDTALNVLGEAHKISPTDVRAPWFQATLRCQTTQPKTGADEFLSIENSQPWDQLPTAFWDDYMECATVTNMPAHILRASYHLEKLHAPSSEMRRFLLEIASKRFDAFDPKKNYETKDAWYSNTVGQNWDYTCTSCGLRFRARGDWSIDRLELTNGSGVAVIGTGPYQAAVHKLHPNILVLIQQPKAGETLKDYAKKFMKDGSFESFIPSRCPASLCIAMKADQPGMYGKDGDGHGRVIAFERDQPDFPGLIFEDPMEISKPETTEKITYYRPNQTKQRIPGKLYYLILLDTAASIEEPAIKDLDFFMENLTVE